MPLEINDPIQNNITYTKIKIIQINIDTTQRKLVVMYKRGYNDGQDDIWEPFSHNIIKQDIDEDLAYTGYMTQESATYSNVQARAYALIQAETGITGTIV